VTIVLDAEASRTVQVLVEQYGFDLERSVEAVQALGNKSDVGLAVSWLLDGGEEDRGGAVEFVHCPHLDGPDSAPLIDPGQLPAYNGAKCSVEGCASTKEPWVCLHCAGMFGSRYACGHALTHFESMRSHTAALSLSDLSVWCYACSAYVHHERVHRSELNYSPQPVHALDTCPIVIHCRMSCACRSARHLYANGGPEIWWVQR